MRQRRSKERRKGREKEEQQEEKERSRTREEEEQTDKIRDPLTEVREQLFLERRRVGRDLSNFNTPETPSLPNDMLLMFFILNVYTF